ncbi:MAG: polyphosphate kinase 2 [Desulfuromonadaceae bacterium]|nr:polyphosphate kinase 2 [Desulfuromonadaceae bacterium]
MGKKEKQSSGSRINEAVGKQGKKLKGKEYEKQLKRLHGDLVSLQEWLKKSGHRVVVVFEGRDAAGKGGVIKAITERVSPRVFRVVALPAPSEKEKTQVYMQRYIQHFPSAGEIILFDRSWYNRAGVERVMGFCTEKEYIHFLQVVPLFERMLVDSGVQLIKYWLEINMEEQEKRFRSRVDDPRKIWKLSPLDIESYHRWYDYSKARDAMLTASDIKEAPWYIVPFNDQKRGRLNCISHLLSLIPYEKPDHKKTKLGERVLDNAYDDRASLEGRKFIPEIF